MHFSPKMTLVIAATWCSLQTLRDRYRQEESKTQVLWYSVMDRQQLYVVTSSGEWPAGFEQLTYNSFAP